MISSDLSGSSSSVKQVGAITRALSESHLHTQPVIFASVKLDNTLQSRGANRLRLVRGCLRQIDATDTDCQNEQFLGPSIHSSCLPANRFQTGPFLVKMISFQDPQTTALCLWLGGVWKSMVFWKMVRKLTILYQNVTKFQSARSQPLLDRFG